MEKITRMECVVKGRNINIIKNSLLAHVFYFNLSLFLAAVVVVEIYDLKNSGDH